MKGYSKWIILNQVVKEEHPEHTDLEQIVSEIRDKSTPKPIDEIYQGLQKFYPDKFMHVSKQEVISL